MCLGQSASLSQSQAIGIDIGGTKMAIALVRAGGTILNRAVLPTEAELGFNRAIARLTQAIQGLLTPYPQAITGIGIGCAGPLDSSRGLINNPYTLSGWNQCDIVTPLSKAFRV